MILLLEQMQNLFGVVIYLNCQFLQNLSILLLASKFSTSVLSDLEKQITRRQLFQIKITYFGVL